MRMFFVAVIAFAALLFASPARAQSDFGGLDLQPGDQIYVTQPSGVEVGGRLTRISPVMLEINGYEFKPEPGLKIERSGDPLLNGALIGFGFGALMGATIGGEGCLREPLWHCVVGGGVVYGAIGTLWDWLRVGRTPIYRGTAATSARSPRLTPLVTSTSKGAALTFIF